MEYLEGTEITGAMIKKVVESDGPGKNLLWLAKSGHTWNVVAAGGVDGTEDHVLTQGTILSRTPRVKVKGRWEFDYEVAAANFESQLSQW